MTPRKIVIAVALAAITLGVLMIRSNNPEGGWTYLTIGLGTFLAVAGISRHNPHWLGIYRFEPADCPEKDSLPSIDRSTPFRVIWSWVADEDVQPEFAHCKRCGSETSAKKVRVAAPTRERLELLRHP